MGVEAYWCPVCGGGPLLHSAAMDNNCWVCTDCGYEGPRRLERGGGLSRHGAARQRPEHDVVRLIRQALVDDGRTVLRVQQHDARRAGSDRGVPDLLVHIHGGLWTGLEVKAPGRKAACTPEQRAMRDAGWIGVVDGVDGALEWIARVEDHLSGPSGR